ncbi:MAG: hypothetical protein WCP38_00660 [Chloroflexota bacterium]
MLNRSLAALLSSVLLGALFIGTPAQVNASIRTWYISQVDTSGGSSSCTNPDFLADGTDEQEAFISAFMTVGDGDTIHVCAGTYDFTAVANYHPVAGTVVYITGDTAANTILDGNSITSFFDFEDTNVHISNLTFTNGKNTLNEFGGAISAWGGNSSILFIDHSIFANNEANCSGGAIFSEGTVWVEWSTFSNNAIAIPYCWGDGGAIGIGDEVEADLHIWDSNFESNTASDVGGAIYFCGTNGVVDILRSEFVGNTADHEGGAVSAYNCGDLASELTVTDSTFRENSSAYWGGALSSGMDDSILSFNEFSSNSSRNGGALDLFGDESIELSRNTFRSNSASFMGGAISTRMLIGPGDVSRTNTFQSNRARRGKNVGLYAPPWGNTTFVEMRKNIREWTRARVRDVVAVSSGY